MFISNLGFKILARQEAERTDSNFSLRDVTEGETRINQSINQARHFERAS